MVGGCVGRAEFEAALELRLSRFPLPIVKPQYGRQRRVGLGEIGVEPQGSQCRGLSLGERLVGREITVPPQEHVGIGDTGVGKAVAGVFPNCLLKVLDRLVEPFFGPTVPVMTTLQIKPVGLGILGVMSGESLLFCPRQLQPQFFRYLVGNFVLDHKDVARLAIILRAP